MASMVIKIIDKNRPDLVQKAEEELAGAGFAVVFKTEVDLLGVDAVKHSGGEQVYGPAVIIVGEK